MTTQIIIFEDYFVENFYPLTLTRPVFDLKIGTMSNFKRLQKLYPQYELGIFTRKILRNLLYEKYAIEINYLDPNADRYLFINGRIVTNEPIPVMGNDEIGIQGETVSYIRVSKENLKKVPDFLSKFFMEELPKIETKRTDFFEIKYPWDIIKINGEYILKDFNVFYKNDIKSPIDNSIIIKKENIVFIDENVKIGEYTVIDATNGPVIVGKNTEIEPFTFIKGPAFIGEENYIKPHTQIFGGTSIHYKCKIGGEVSNSIFHSFSNKVHHGFIGHSYIGKWVNFGAGTSNSNLKNNYSYINVILNGKTKTKTDMQFLGVIVGDYAKFAINSSINSGTIVGFSANVFSSGELLPKYIPNFAWGLKEKYILKKAIEDARKMMARRNINLTPHLENLFKYIYENFS